MKQIKSHPNDTENKSVGFCPHAIVKCVHTYVHVSHGRLGPLSLKVCP